MEFTGITSGSARVARSLLRDGPTTAATLAQRLGLTPQAVRRHLDQLSADGLIDSGLRAPFGPAPVRGRGRPAKVFFLTEAGRDLLENSYDDLAVDVLRYLRETGGPEAVAAYASHRAADLIHRYDGADLDELADLLTADGYAASVVPGAAGEPVQLCQHHCPVSHVAGEFPEFCEAETAALSKILGRHVTRLATIAHGDGVCTSVVAPQPPNTKVDVRTSPQGKAAR